MKMSEMRNTLWLNRLDITKGEVSEQKDIALKII